MAPSYTAPAAYDECVIEIDVTETPSKDVKFRSATIELTFSNRQYAKLYYDFVSEAMSNLASINIFADLGRGVFLILEAPSDTTTTPEIHLEHPIEINTAYLQFSNSAAANRWQRSTGLWRTQGTGSGGPDGDENSGKRLWFEDLFTANEFKETLGFDDEKLRNVWSSASCVEVDWNTCSMSPLP